MAIFFPFFLFTQICIRPFLFLYFSFPALVWLEFPSFFILKRTTWCRGE
jgi:hypothetical protein